MNASNSMNETGLRTGFVGVLATAGGTAVSILPQIEEWLRIASLAVGLAVGIVTLVRLLQKNQHKRKKP